MNIEWPLILEIHFISVLFSDSISSHTFWILKEWYIVSQKSGEISILISPALHSCTGVCISFVYYVHGYKYGKLSVKVNTIEGLFTLWTVDLSGFVRTPWKQENVNIDIQYQFQVHLLQYSLSGEINLNFFDNHLISLEALYSKTKWLVTRKLMRYQ